MKYFYHIITSFFLFLLVLNVSAQDKVYKLKFDEEKQERDAQIYIANKVEFMELTFTSKVEQGSVSLSIFNPENEEVVSFILVSNSKAKEKIKSLVDSLRLKSDKNKNKESIGKLRKVGSIPGGIEIKKLFKNPMKGDWIIKLKGNRAKGFVELDMDVKI